MAINNVNAIDNTCVFFLYKSNVKRGLMKWKTLKQCNRNEYFFKIENAKTKRVSPNNITILFK
jgi:hypothetical protein